MRSIFLGTLSLFLLVIMAGWIAALATGDPSGFNLRPILSVGFRVYRAMTQEAASPLPESERETTTDMIGKAARSLDPAAIDTGIRNAEARINGQPVEENSEASDSVSPQQEVLAADPRAVGCPVTSLTGTPASISQVDAKAAMESWESGTLLFSDFIQVQSRFGEPSCIIGTNRWVYWVRDDVGVITASLSSDSVRFTFLNIK